MDYKKILEGVVNIINTTEKSDIGFANICSYIGENCPELKESEDRQHRKWILEYLYDGLRKSDEQFKGQFKSAIAWLEKQGQTFTKKDVDDAYLKGVCDTKHEFEKQGEKNPVAIPKFRVGDFVKDANYHGEPTYEIVGMDGECYICQYRGNKSMGDRSVMHFCFDNPYLRLVEQNPVRQQCADFYNKNGELQMPRLTAFENELANILFDREYDGSTETEDDIQRGKLDYELAAIRLAPKLQSLINIEQNPTWSEEDEKMLNSIIEDFGDGKTSNMLQEYFLKSLKSRVQPHPKQEWNEEDERLFQIVIDILDRQNHLGNISHTDLIACVRKLKSLRPQTTWKPSDEQMKVLDVAIKSSHLTTAEYNGLVKLREQLKKL